MPAATKDTPAKDAKAPGPSVVEALAAPRYAKRVGVTVQQAADALRREWTADGRTLTDGEECDLDGLEALGIQIVTATTPVGGAS